MSKGVKKKERDDSIIVGGGGGGGVANKKNLEKIQMKTDYLIYSDFRS